MEIIFGRENAEVLREKYTVLDLETIQYGEDKDIEVFCLISAEKIGLTDLSTLQHYIKLHNQFLEGYKNKNYDFCRQGIDVLRGQFGGELDTFYDEIARRINEIDPQE